MVTHLDLINFSVNYFSALSRWHFNFVDGALQTYCGKYPRLVLIEVDLVFFIIWTCDAAWPLAVVIVAGGPPAVK